MGHNPARKGKGKKTQGEGENGLTPLSTKENG
jgi:hypothetical protein